MIPSCVHPKHLSEQKRLFAKPSMRLQKKAAVVFLVFLVVSGCSNSNETETERQPIIRVDDHVLSLAEFNEFFELTRTNYATEQVGAGPGLREARLRFFLQLLEEMIILRRAEELHLHVSTTELEDAVGGIKGDYSDESFKAMMMKQAISVETWKERLRRQLLAKKVIRKELLEGISVTPEEISDYYGKHHEEWTHGEQIRPHQILLSSEEEANRVLERLEKGEDFAALARLYSVAPESEQGGDMGYMERGHLPKSLEDPLFALKKDTLSPVIKTPYGYHIFKVVDQRPASEPVIDDCIEKIRGYIQEQKLETSYGPWLTKLRSRYRITVNKELI